MAPERIFGAQEHTDKTEGKGGAKVVGWFATQEAAQRVSDTLPGVYGEANTLPLVVSVLYDSAEEFPGFSTKDEAKRQRIQELEAELARLRAED